MACEELEVVVGNVCQLVTLLIQYLVGWYMYIYIYISIVATQEEGLPEEVVNTLKHSKAVIGTKKMKPPQ